MPAPLNRAVPPRGWDGPLPGTPLRRQDGIRSRPRTSQAGGGRRTLPPMFTRSRTRYTRSTAGTHEGSGARLSSVSRSVRHTWIILSRASSGGWKLENAAARRAVEDCRRPQVGRAVWALGRGQRQVARGLARALQRKRRMHSSNCPHVYAFVRCTTLRPHVAVQTHPAPPCEPAHNGMKPHPRAGPAIRPRSPRLSPAFGVALTWRLGVRKTKICNVMLWQALLKYVVLCSVLC